MEVESEAVCRSRAERSQNVVEGKRVRAMSVRRHQEQTTTAGDRAITDLFLGHEGREDVEQQLS